MIAPPTGAERTIKVTVLKADISGSTPLGARLDAEDLRSVLGSYFAALAREIQLHQGYVDKFIGDAVLAVFGLPEPSEDDAARAVLAALGMHEAIARENEALMARYGVRLACRIGVNTGELHDDRAEGSADVALIGETVTLAEKLEAAAALDTVLVSASTREAAGERFEWQPMPDVRVRGREPLPSFRPLRVLEPGALASAAAARPTGRGPSRSLQVQGTREHVLEEERKIVTVLFADISSDEPLGARLPAERLREVLGDYFGVLARAIQHHGGTIDKYVGDAVMAVFGAPVSHEDDAARAIGAALAIQRASRALNESLEREHGLHIGIRVGINTGEVVAGLLPGEVHAYTVTGDAVNTAQRIESASPPGEVLVSEATRALALKAHVFAAVPPLTLKGKPEPVPAYRVLGPERRAVPRGGPTLVGREEELAALFGFYRRAAAGQGQVLHLHGEAGIGKTRLVAEMLAALPAEAMRVRARATSYEQATPYALVADLVRRLFTVPADEPEGVARGALAQTLDHVEETSREAAVDVLLETLGYSVRSPLDPEGKRRLVVTLLRGTLERRSAAAPLVVLIEDLHWTDATSAGVLAELAQAVPALRCLFLSTSREARDVAWPAQQVGLRALPREAAAAMIDRLVAAPLDDATRDLVLERTAGNPFFIEEVVRSLHDGKAGAVPATVQELLESRLDALDAAPRHVVQRAAVIGRLFARGVLERVAPGEELDAGLATLERERFVDRIAADPEPVYSFPHALVQEVAYRTQLISQRRRTHVTVGDAYADLFRERLEDYVDTLAFHYRNGDDDPKARTWLLRAGHRAQRLYANAEALDYFREAVGRSGDDGAARADAHEGLADVQRVTGAFGSALAAYTEALAARPAVDVVPRCRLLRKSGFVHYLQGDPDAAGQIFADVLTALPPDAPAERARTLQSMGEMRWREGDYEPAIAYLDEAVAEARQAGDDEARAEALKQLGTAHIQKGDHATARRYYLEALELYERVGDLLGQGNMHNNLGAVARRESRLDEAITRYEQARAIRERIGDQAGLVLTDSNLGEIAFLRGELETARRHYESAVAIARSIGFGMGLAVALTGAGATKVELDEPAQAEAGRRDLIAALAEMERTGNRAFLVEILRDASHAHLRSDATKSLELAERALALAEEIGSPERLGIALQALGQAREARGDTAGAVEALERSRAILEAGSERQELARTLAALGRTYAGLPPGDARRLEAERLIAQARSALQELGAALDLRRMRR